MKLIPARNYTPAHRSGARLLVIHSMEAPEKPGTAKSVANWFAGPVAPKASAHYCVDSVDVIQSVRDEDIAWAAPGANNDGIHVELAGYARQSAAEWDDAYSKAELTLAAHLCADLAAKWDIPIRRLTVEQVKDGKTRGFCGHSDVSKAFGKSDHTDPGKGFPWDSFMALVQSAAEAVGEEPLHVA